MLDETSLKLFELGVCHPNVHLDGFNSFRKEKSLCVRLLSNIAN